MDNYSLSANKGRPPIPIDQSDSYINRQLKECSFRPEIDKNSRKLARSNPPIYERVISQPNEYSEYENKSHY